MQQLNPKSLTRAEDIASEDRYPDSGATNHLTNNLQNLNLDNKGYTGMPTIHMENGKTINITHVGTSNIQGKRHLYLL